MRSTGQRRTGQPWLRRLSRMARYFAHISQRGSIRYGDVPGSIGVVEALDKFMPIGETLEIGYNADGLGLGNVDAIGGTLVFAARKCMAGRMAWH